MPSFFKHSKGIQKPQLNTHKPIFYVIEKPQSYLHFNGNDLNYFMPPPLPLPPLLPPPLPQLPPPQPTSSVFDSKDCIWFYGTVYVKEAVAVAKLHAVPKSVVHNANPATNDTHENHENHDDNDDDAESVSSSISSGKRSIAKQNQIKYLKHGMRLRHLVSLSSDEWFATFDADANRIIRTPDGVAFDTLRQFARLHHNEVLATTTGLTNVWSDAHFQYEDNEGQWHPLSNLKKK
jgi:hypothetical protein